MRDLDFSVEDFAFWLTAVVDAQTEWDTLSPEEKALETGADPADEYWGFFSEWRHSITDEHWKRYIEEGK